MKYPVLPLSRHDGPEGLPVRGPHHEEAAPSQAHPALRCLHPGGAHLYHHGAHEIRIYLRFSQTHILFFIINNCKQNVKQLHIYL